MAFHIVTTIKGIFRGSAFKFLSRFFYAELLTAGLYLLIWIDPFLFGEKGFDGLSRTFVLEFVFAHFGTAFGLVNLLGSTSKKHGKYLIGCSVIFYFLLVGSISWFVGNIFTIASCLMLCIRRVKGLDNDNIIGGEMLFSFLKAMLFMVAMIVGYLFAQVFPAPIENLPGEKGVEAIPAAGMVYFGALHFIEINKGKWKAYVERKNKNKKRQSR